MGTEKNNETLTKEREEHLCRIVEELLPALQEQKPELFYGKTSKEIVNELFNKDKE